MAGLPFFASLRFLSVLTWCALTAFAEVQPEVAGPEGERAFRELEAMYGKAENEPPFQTALQELKDQSPEKSAAAGRYLLALFRQSLADQTNGRSPIIPGPRPESPEELSAGRFRQKLVSAFGSRAQGKGALEPVEWLLLHDDDARTLEAAAQVLARIDSPRVEAVLGALLEPPHPSGAVLATAVQEAGRRELKALAPRVQALRTHHRDKVRAAAEKAAPALGLPKTPPPRQPETLSPWLLEELAAIRAMVPEPVPENAAWYQFIETTKNGPVSALSSKQVQSGWLLREDAQEMRLLNWHGEVISLAAAHTTRTALPLAEMARLIIRMQKQPAERRRLFMRETPPFPGAEIVNGPLGLVAAWCAERGDQASAADLLYPCLNALADDRDLRRNMQRILGNLVEERLIDCYTERRDFPAALVFADRLASSPFAGTPRQACAHRLAEQLRRHPDDFKTFALPTEAEWKNQQAALPRAGQIQYLLEHLRLLNCFSLDALPHYDTPQDGRAFSERKSAGSLPVINPYTKLRDLKLKVADLPLLVPSLADEEYLPTFAVRRMFGARELHQVNRVVADLINEVALRDLAKLDDFERASEEGRRAHLASLQTWCTANAGKSAAELRLDILRLSKDWLEIAQTANAALQTPGTASILLERMNEFPQARLGLAQFIYQTRSRVALEGAAEWVKDADPKMRLWGAIVYLRDGPAAANPGLPVVQELLASQPEMQDFELALQLLLARKEPEAISAALAILRNKQLAEAIYLRGDLVRALHRLVLTGRSEVLDFLLKNLEDLQPTGGAIQGSWKGRRVTRKKLRADQFAEVIARWRNDNWYFQSIAPDAERAAQRAELEQWLKAQFALLQENKPAGFREAKEMNQHQRVLW